MKKSLIYFLILIVGLTIAITVTAFNNPSGNPPTGGGAIGVGSNAPANSIYIKSDGNIGVGTSSPIYKLDVQNGQINASGGLCIAGICKSSWDQITGTNYWTLNGSNLYPNLTSYILGVGTASPDSNYKITTSGGGIKAESTNQPAGYFSSASGYGLIVNSGNVGIGNLSPATKLDVSGTVKMTGFQLGTSATVGNILTADANGVGGWATASGIPSGVIVMWSGSITSIPSGWALCDGTNGTPDLRSKFIVGAGSSYAVGSTGGSLTHTHTGRTAQDTSGDYRAWNAGPGSSGNNADASRGYHTQTFTTDSSNALPPYYALAYIMKL